MRIQQELKEGRVGEWLDYLEVGVDLQVDAELLDERDQHGVADGHFRIRDFSRLDVRTHVQHHVKVPRTQGLK